MKSLILIVVTALDMFTVSEADGINELLTKKGCFVKEKLKQNSFACGRRSAKCKQAFLYTPHAHHLILLTPHNITTSPAGFVRLLKCEFIGFFFFPERKK